jgi:hypothetical protein
MRVESQRFALRAASGLKGKIRLRSALLVIAALSILCSGSVVSAQQRPSVFRDWGNSFIYAHIKLTTVGGQVITTPSMVPPAVPVVNGTIVVDLSWFDYGYQNAIPPANGSVVVQYSIDGQPVSNFVTGPPFAWQWNTTSIADGTHVITLRVVDGTGVTYPIDQLRSTPQTVVVQNRGPVNGAQKVPVPGFYFKAYHEPPVLDWVTYPGTPQWNTVHPYPYKFVPPSNNVALRNPYAWFVEGLTENPHHLYTASPQFYTTQKGGVIVQGYLPGAGDSAENSVTAVSTHDNFDGGRDNNMVDPYSTIVASPDGSGWIGVDLANRVFKIALDGGVTTIAGYKPFNMLQYDYRDLTISEQQWYVEGSQIAGLNLNMPTDLVFDPRNPSILYFADNQNHQVVKFNITTLASSVYAGTTSVAGYQDGPALSAKFNQPYSLTMAPDGTMYVADFNNSAIRKISSDGATVSTLVGGGKVPSQSIVAANRDSYSSATPVSFSSALIPYPQVIRLDSSGNIVLGEAVSQVVRYINLSAKTVTRIYAIKPLGSSTHSWIWLDVDTIGTIGPKDDILLAVTTGFPGNTILRRLSIDGATVVNVGSDGGPLTDGQAQFVADPGSHYPWTVAISKTEGRFICAGFGTTGIMSWRTLQPTDPPYNVSLNNYSNGRTIWLTGTVGGFPWGSRPAFSAIGGDRGVSHLGVIPSFDDLMTRYPDDASLGNYLQSGMGGSVPRPEITGNDLRDLIYFVRRNSLQGGSLSPVAPGPGSSDVTAPVISNVLVSHTSSTSVTISWSTDKPTLGFVAAGSTIHYNWWSNLENTFSTTHSVSLTGIPESFQFFSIVSKDLAGNQSFYYYPAGAGGGNPVISITSPASGANVSGAVSVVANPSDSGAKINSVQFKLDSGILGSAITTAPYSITWDTTKVINGLHSLVAIVLDSSGSEATSSPVIVNVSNGGSGSLNVSVTSPAPSSKVSTTVVVTANASDTKGTITGVQFKLDGTKLGIPATSAPYSIAWDTTKASNGPHVLTALVSDNAGNQSISAPVSVTVANAANGSIIVSISSPPLGSKVSNSISITATATDTKGTITGVQFKLDGGNLGNQATNAPYSVVWNTTTSTNGAHVLTAMVSDNAGNQATSASVPVIVSNNGANKLAVSITLPIAGSTLSGAVNISATASDVGSSVTRVQFLLDNANIGPQLTAAPYSTQLNTASIANGSHTISAIASDSSGNTAQAPGIVVTIANGSNSSNKWNHMPVNGDLYSGWPGNLNWNKLIFEASTGKTLLISGENSCTIFTNSMWAYDTASNTFQIRTWSGSHPDQTCSQKPMLPQTLFTTDFCGAGKCSTPLGYFGDRHPYWTTAYDSRRNVVYQYGGVEDNIACSGATNGICTYSDMWVYASNSTPSPVHTGWQRLCDNCAPGVRLETTMEYDPDDDIVLVYGGLNAGNPIGDTWEYSPATNTWTNICGTFSVIAPCSPGPGNRAGFGLVYVGNHKFVFFGGYNHQNGHAQSTAYNDTWVFDASTRTWTQQKPAVSPPVFNPSDPTAVEPASYPRYPKLAYDTKRHLVWYHTGNPAETNQDWTYDPVANTWTNQPNTGGPVWDWGYGQYGNALSYDPVHDILIGKGGLVEGTDNTQIFQLALSNSVGRDTTPPSVAISAPSVGATVSGKIDIHANASDNVAVAGVQFQLDGTNFGPEVLNSPYSLPWDTTSIANGTHVLTAVAFDTSNNQTTSNAVRVTVSNSASVNPMTVLLVTPQSGAKVSGRISVSATATSSARIAGVQFLLDGGTLGSKITSAPYSVAWDSTKASNGFHVLSAIAFDKANNQATSNAVTVTVANSHGTANPSVTLVSPAVRATISGAVIVNVATSGFSGVPVVQFRVDGINLGSELFVAPYAISWDTTAATNGSHILSVTASDPAGDTVSASEIVQVNNKAGVGTPTPLPGSKVIAAMDSLTQFTVQADELALSVSACSECRFESESDLIAGQTTVVLLRAGSSTPTADKVVLHQGAINGTVIAVSNDHFTMQLLGAPGPAAVVVEVTSGVTQLYDFLSASGPQVGQTVAVRGLLFKSGQNGTPTLIAGRIKLVVSQ